MRAIVPFAIMASMGVATVFVPPYAGSLPQTLLATAITLVTILVAVIAVRRGRRTWLDPVAPWLFFVAFVALRDASGGASSGLAPLVALPICWLVLFGTRRQLFGAAALTLTSFVGPLLLLGEPAYPASDWRRALLWSAFALLVAPVMQAVAHELQRTRHDERQLTAELEGLMRSATLSSVIATDVNGTITRFSPGAERLLGYRADQLVGICDPGVLHDPDEVSALAAELGVPSGFPVFAELARLDRPSRIWTYVRQDGQRLSVRLAITELRGDGDVLLGYLGVAIDATDAVASQRELERSEARWRRVTERLADTTVLVLTEQLDVELVAGAGAFAVGIGDGAGHNLAAFSTTSNVTIVSGLVHDALHGIDGRTELRSTVNGSEQDVFVTALPTGPDEPPQALLMARDIGPARKRERALVRERARADRIFEHSPVGMALLDHSERLVAANPALVAMLSVGPDELTGTPIVDVAPWHDAVAAHLARHHQSPARDHHSVITLPVGSDGRHLALSTISLGQDGATGAEILLHVQDVTDRQRHEASLSHLADHDPLTGLANRRRFGRELDAHLALPGRRHTGALLVVDLDHFKSVNDTLGHVAGDALLVAVADVLRRCVRDTDLVARLGGDEFAILLPETDAHGAERVVAAVVRAVRELTHPMPGPEGRVTASAGVVLVDDADRTATSLLAAADAAMYEAKSSGRGQWAPWSGPGRREGRRSGNDRRAARLVDIDTDRLVLHLQPILDLRTNRVTGAEALVRLRDGEDLLLPADFLPAAERTGAVVELDAWVAREATGVLARLQRVAPEFLLCVNVSGRSAGQPLFDETLSRAIEQHSVAASGLVLELTETAAVAGPDALEAFAALTRRIGCRIAIDDFGTGYGSFHYLDRLDVDIVKIDGAFVPSAGERDEGRIFGAIVEMSRRLGLRTVAECVRDEQALRLCREGGVDLAQGYFIGRPEPVDIFVERLI